MLKYKGHMNLKKINKEARNPYLLSYLSFALICAISLGLVFLMISTKVSREEQAIRDKARLELISENVHQQLSFMRKIEIEIRGNSVYYPQYFTEYKYYELEVLKNFEQYLSRLSMVDEILLYYGDNRVFRSSGSISDFDVYFREESGVQKEELRTWLNSSSWQGFSFKKTKNIYIGIPLEAISNQSDFVAKLCFEIDEATFAEYLEMLGGISNGKFGLYYDEYCLYSNTDENLRPDKEEKNKLVIKDDTYDLTFVFIPNSTMVFGGNYIILSISLIFSIIIWMVMMAYLFAGRTYKPIKLFIDKYRMRMGYEEHSKFRDNLEEMDEAIEQLFIQHKEVREQLDTEEKRLEEMILRSFLKGDHTDIISKYMECVQIDLNGNFFFVCSVFFEEEMLEGEFTNSVSEIFESRIRDDMENATIYVLSRTNPRDMSIICCLWRREDKMAVVEAIKKAAEEFCKYPLVGYGEVYDSLNKLSASYFESLDRLNRAKDERNRNTDILEESELNSKSVLQFLVYLRTGEEKKALDELHLLIGELESKKLSFLMQQYFLTEFIYNISNTAKECYIEVSPQSLSLLLSARSLKEFGEAVEIVVRRFCEALKARESESALNKSKEIVDYIAQHFMEYDISIESVARILNVKVEQVRSSIMQHCGKSYKEYVLSLRMEESRRLLIEERLSVEEVSRRVGYANASYFIKLFKKAYGITPADYKLINELPKS